LYKQCTNTIYFLFVYPIHTLHASNWARKKADWYDPFIELNDEDLERIDRDKLEPIPLKDG
jgi:hypothetical protein